jgi:hypothetical protein
MAKEASKSCNAPILQPNADGGNNEMSGCLLNDFSAYMYEEVKANKIHQRIGNLSFELTHLIGHEVYVK